MDPVLIDNTLNRVRQALEHNNVTEALALLNALDPIDSADSIYELTTKEKAQIVMALEPDDAADLMEEFDEEETVEVALALPEETLVQLLAEMEPDDAADLLGDLEPEQAEQLLGQMEVEDADEIRPLMAYEDDTSGGLMTSDIPALLDTWTVAEAFDFLRREQPSADDHYYLYVVDTQQHLKGVVGLRQMIVALPETPITAIMNPEVRSVLPTEDQEEAARVFSRYGLLALPVVDENGKLVGVMTSDDLVEVLEEENTEDIYGLSNMSTDSDLYVWSPIRDMVRQRLPWLFINLATAFFAAFIISRFEYLFAQIAVLAVFQSVVAGMGGNSGTQALAIMVRGLALGELELWQVRKVLVREFVIGTIHGLAVGLGVAGVAVLWSGNPWLGLVIGLATFGNLVIGGLAGTLVPMTLRALKLDPALASSVLVTTITDSGGFALFLGLASLLLPLLLGGTL